MWWLILAWVVFGYLWAVFFVHVILDNKRWVDAQHRPLNILDLGLMMFASPVMASVAGLFCILNFLAWCVENSPRLFGIKNG
jgi:hypothetical protein